MIKRYDIHCSEEYGNAIEIPAGDWVKYDDHETEVDRLQDEITHLQATVDELSEFLMGRL